MITINNQISKKILFKLRDKLKEFGINGKSVENLPNMYFEHKGEVTQHLNLKVIRNSVLKSNQWDELFEILNS